MIRRIRLEANGEDIVFVILRNMEVFSSGLVMTQKKS